MTTFFDKLNLRPQERRMLVGVLVVVFIVLNLWFVRPHFGDWGTTKRSIGTVENTLKKFQDEIGRVPQYKAKITKLQNSGSDVLTEELQLQRTVQSLANSHGLMVSRYDPRQKSTSTRTNQFFEEQMLSIDFTSGGKELVDFLVDVAAGNSMIRVRDMNIKPDQSQTRLAGNISLVASYQKKQATNKPPAAITNKKK